MSLFLCERGVNIKLLNILENKKIRLKLVLAIIMGLLATICSVFVPFIFKDFLDTLIKEKNFDKQQLVILLILLFVYLLLLIVSQYLLKIVGIEIVSVMRSKVINQLLKLEKQFFDEHSPGDLGSILTNDTSLISTLITNNIPELVTSIFLVICILVSMFFLSASLSIILILLLPLTLLIFIPLGNVLSKLSLQNQKHLGTLNQFANFITTNNDFIKDNITQDYEINRGKSIVDRLKENGIKQALYTAIISPILSIILIIMILFILTMGIYLVSLDNLTIGSFVAYLLLTVEILNPITSIGNNLTLLKILKGATSRITNLLEEERVEHLNGSSFRLTKINKIEFKNLSFSYLGSQKILKNINFSIHRGEIIAIVGPSGSGKSTIINLMTGKYRNYSGDIFINDKNIQLYSLKSLRNNISVFSQKSVLFSGSIRENLLYGVDRDISDSEILSLSKKTNLFSVINKTDEGLSYKINQGETNFSEGEKQRLSITSALFKNSSLLLLDEITSALDAENEYRIMETINNISDQYCTILITHRLSTIKKVDKIIFLEDGNITGIGSHEELFSEHKRYKKYVQSQLQK